MDDSKAPEAAAAAAAPYTWVDTPAAFQLMLDALTPAGRIAIDIEADSLYHYFEKVCLIQISTDDLTFVLDPLALSDLSALAPIMSDTGVEKVFHAASYDVLSLRRDFDFSFSNIFDTHMAAQLLGYPELGLSALLAKLIGVAHSKHRQRDDWSRRPLGREQLQYAAMDTHHLLAMRDRLEARLREKGRWEWALEEFEVAAAVETREKEFDPEGFRRIKGSRHLTLRELAILRALFLLRDRLAREMDLPPFKVLNNSVLLDLARRPPASPGALSGRPGISGRIAQRHSRDIQQAIESARSQDPSYLAPPERTPWKPPPHETKLRLERLKAWRESKARELELQAGVVFPGDLLENFALSPPSDLKALENLRGMRRWRARTFGSEILHLLHSNP